MAAYNNRVPPIGSNVVTTDDVLAAGFDFVYLKQGGMLKVQEGTVVDDLTIKGDVAFNIVPMAFTTSPAGSDVDAGDSISLTAAVSGGLSPYKYQWFKSVVSDTYPSTITSTEIDASKNASAATATLTIADAEESDAGNYFVRVKDSADNIIASGDAHVKVGAEAVVAVTGVTVSPATSSVVVGSTRQITPTVAPADATNKAVTYSSSNTAVATVNASGLVTGVSAGSAVITTTTADGAKTATTNLTVTAS